MGTTLRGDGMSYQVFTRSWTMRRVGRPRRSHIVDTQDQARAFCGEKNAHLTAAQTRRGFKYEYANVGWYQEAFGR